MLSASVYAHMYIHLQSEYARYGMISLKVCASSGPNPSLKRVRSPSVKGTPFIVKLRKGVYIHVVVVCCCCFLLVFTLFSYILLCPFLSPRLMYLSKPVSTQTLDVVWELSLPG